MATQDTTPATATLTGRSVIGPGIAAGVIAALVMALVWSIVEALQGQGFWSPAQLIGALYMGTAVVAYPFWSAVLGIVTHLIIGAIFGVVFAALMRRVESPGLQAAAGLAYGAVIFLVMTYLVLPWADPVLFVNVDPGWFFLYHLVFGLILPLGLPIRRQIARRAVARSTAYTRP